MIIYSYWIYNASIEISDILFINILSLEERKREPINMNLYPYFLFKFLLNSLFFSWIIIVLKWFIISLLIIFIFFFSNKCLIIVQFVNINISLIIDDSKTAKVTIDLNNADDNDISSLCEELSNKFSLDEQVKNNVYLQLQNIINKIKKKQNSKKNIDETFNRLYYIDIEKRKKSIEKNYQLKKEQQQKELEKYTFKPLINDNFLKLGKPNKKFEERLYIQIKIKT